MQLDELGERPLRVARVALDLGRAGEVAEHERVRRRAVDQPERDARVRRDAGASPAPRPRAARRRARAPSTTSRSAAPAMKSETTASTEIPQPAIAIPVCPVGTNTEREPAPLRLAVELERDGHLPDRAVGADREHDPRRHLEVRAGRDVQPVGRLAQVAQLDAVPRGELDQLGVVARGTRAARSRRRARPRSQLFSSSRQAGGKRPPCVATPTSAVVGSKAERLVDRRRRSGCPS